MNKPRKAEAFFRSNSLPAVGEKRCSSTTRRSLSARETSSNIEDRRTETDCHDERSIEERSRAETTSATLSASATTVSNFPTTAKFVKRALDAPASKRKLISLTRSTAEGNSSLTKRAKQIAALSTTSPVSSWCDSSSSFVAASNAEKMVFSEFSMSRPCPGAAAARYRSIDASDSCERRRADSCRSMTVRMDETTATDRCSLPTFRIVDAFAKTSSDSSRQNGNSNFPDHFPQGEVDRQYDSTTEEREETSFSNETAKSYELSDSGMTKGREGSDFKELLEFFTAQNRVNRIASPG